MTMRMPIFVRSVTSCANVSQSASSVIAAPPYFTTKVAPSYCWIYGSASIRISVFSPCVTLIGTVSASALCSVVGIDGNVVL